MHNDVQMVENRIQGSIILAMDNIIMARMELAVRSKHICSVCDVEVVAVNSDLREQAGTVTPLLNAFDRDKIDSEPNLHDKIRGLNTANE